MPSFVARFFADQLSQSASDCGLLSNSSIDRPAGATVFDDGAIFVEANVSDLGFARCRAMINMTINDQTATNAAAQCDVKNRIEVYATAMGCFAESAHVGIIVDNDRQPRGGGK